MLGRFGAACLGAFAAATLTAGAWAAPRDVAREMRELRSFTFYDAPMSWEAWDFAKYEKGLNDMKAAGANTVWLVLPWVQFQPKALPKPTWNETSLANLDKAVGLAESKGMKAILPLCYLGVGWSPEGIDPRVWCLDKRYYRAFEAYAVGFVGRLVKRHKNMLFLLYTEGSIPDIPSLRDIPVCGADFRAWCKRVNPDLAFWNARWKTSFTWDNLEPLAPKGATQERWDDYWRWSADIMVRRHGELAVKLKKLIAGRALLGYHDFCLVTFDWGKGESPIPKKNPYDFLSMVHYCNPQMTPVADIAKQMGEEAARFRKLYPKTPLIMGESGADAFTFGDEVQAKAARTTIETARRLKIGMNWWMWQDFPCADKVQGSFGVLKESGEPRPTLAVFRELWAGARP